MVTWSNGCNQVPTRIMLVVALLLGACRTPQGAKGNSPDAGNVLGPGHRDIVSGHYADAVVTNRYFSRAHPDSAERMLGVAYLEVHPTKHNGEPALLLIQRSPPSRFQLIDTSLVLERSLTPIWEVMRLGTRVSRFDFDGPSVRVSVTSPDSAPRTVTRQFDQPFFHSKQLDVLVSAVPLRKGYTAIVPLYVQGALSLELDTISVIDKRAGNVWNVRIADRSIVATYGIDGASRRIVSYDVVIRKGGTGRREFAPE